MKTINTIVAITDKESKDVWNLCVLHYVGEKEILQRHVEICREWMNPEEPTNCKRVAELLICNGSKDKSDIPVNKISHFSLEDLRYGFKPYDEDDITEIAKTIFKVLTRQDLQSLIIVDIEKKKISCIDLNTASLTDEDRFFFNH